MITNKELLKTGNIVLKIETNGKNQQEAIEKSFKKINSEVYQHVNGYLVKMNVTSFIVEEYQKETTTKKFLGLFMPVEHESIFIRVRFELEVNYIEKEI